MNCGIKLGRLFGINIWWDWSWLLVFVLISWNLTMMLREAHQGWSWVFTVGIAAAQTRSQGGEVYLLPQAALLVEAPMAAISRYVPL